MVQIKFVKEIPIINGTYKKDNPNKEIGYQKWQVKKTYEVEMLYTIVAKTKKEAEELLEKNECVKVEKVDEYGETFRETITGEHINDMSGDEPVEWKKIEECLPRDDEDIDTGKRFLNYEDPDWSKEDFEWVKNEDGTQIKI
jgi:hypothetical protein|tara:strand:+ start:247 stop:672 length:426 start_codon:yes stop_codon:yes gene_type:complete